MSDGKWIVTGGAGFIGANVVRALAERGTQVVIVDNLSRPSAPVNLEWLESLDATAGLLTVARVDIRDARLVDAVLDEHRDAAVVLHLAGQVAVTSSIADPREDFESNAVGTFNVLEAVRRAAPGAAVLYASTNKVYGDLAAHDLQEAPTRYLDVCHPAGIDEGEVLDPHSPYACSKAAGETYVRDYARIYGLRTVSLRQSCIYGPHQFGIEDQGWVAWFTIAAVLGEELTLYGSGKQVRDLLHVSDLVDLYFAVAGSIHTCAGRAYNVGGGPGNAISLLELVARLEALLGTEVRYRLAPARSADQRVFVANVDRVAQDVGWRPRTSLDEGLADLVAWVRQDVDRAARLLQTG